VIGLARTWLYVPAHRPGLLGKAMATDADAVVCDLEDAVPAGAKETARRNVLAALAAPRPKPLWVRINHPGTVWGQEDIAALEGSGVPGVRVPKCADPADAARAAGRLGVPVHLLVESALGVENAFALARCHPLVAAVSLGEADLLADLRARETAALEWARQRIVVASRAAGLPSPPQSVWTDLADIAGLVADTEAGRDCGFFGRSVVHPRQIGPVNRVFTPDPAEVEAARQMLGSLQDQTDDGVAAWISDDGRFVDPAVVAQARWRVELADRLARGHVPDSAPPEGR
jgi:citrate lyase subunit beta/citryl-CoA lyase